jgi:hypothetical protein
LNNLNNDKTSIAKEKGVVNWRASLVHFRWNVPPGHHPPDSPGDLSPGYATPPDESGLLWGARRVTSSPNHGALFVARRLIAVRIHRRAYTMIRPPDSPGDKSPDYATPPDESGLLWGARRVT